jgi:FkbM family methyltransferase
MHTREGAPPWLDLSVAAIQNHDDFVNSVLRAVLSSGDAFGEENVDPQYPADGAVPGPFDPLARRVAYLKFFLDRSDRLFRVFTLLADNASKELFLSLILFRILGFRRVQLPIDRDSYFAARAQVDALPGSQSSQNDALLHYDFAHGGRDFHLDCLSANLFFTFFLAQYHLNRDGVRIGPREGDIAVDAGACFGDTALDFATAVGPGGHVYSFEVLQSHLDIARFNLGQNPAIGNVTFMPCALGNRNIAGQPAAGEVNPGYVPAPSAPTRSLDSLVWDGTIPRVDFLKMDIEGAEMTALEGAVSALKRFRPRVAISVYHHSKDYYRIPEFIEKLRAGYRMYLANYTISDGETVLYATCE